MKTIIKNEEFFRLAVFLGGDRASGSDRNILRLVKVALYYSEESSLNASEICAKIISDYELEFTKDEIQNAIQSGRDMGIVFDSNKMKYRLTEKEKNRIEFNQINNSFESCIDEFTESQQLSVSNENVKSLVFSFIYQQFNRNANELLRLLKKEKTGFGQLVGLNFSNEEKEIVNQFLTWDNDEKDKYLYRLISFSFEFSMLTVGKDLKSFQNVFRGKTFYFDTNIIFRLMGLNNEERKVVIHNFVKLCTNAGINICYSNFTKREVTKEQ